MKLNSIIYVAIPLLFVSACKKEETKQVFNPLTTRVKTISNNTAGTTETYTYDSENRVTLIQNSNGSKTEFDYNGDTLTQTNFDNTGAVLNMEVILLDSFGLASNSVTTDPAGNILSFHQYYFNSNQEKTDKNDYNNAYIQTGKYEWRWSDGNLVQYSIYDSTVTTKVYDTYYWYYDPATTSVGNINKGQKFWGADSKYLMRKYIQNSYLYGNSLFTFEYTLDELQRLTSMKTYNYQGQLENTITYTYY